MSEAVTRTIEGPVGRITLNRPDKRNAINAEVIAGVASAVDAWALDPDVRVIVIDGAGAGFSAGIDAAWLAGLGASDEAMRGPALREMARTIQATMNRIETVEKPVIAALHRYAIGLGLELALACDFRIVEAGTRMSLPEIYLGLVPDCGGTTRLTRLVGAARAKEAVMLGDAIDPDTALAWGMVTAVAPEGGLADAVSTFAARLVERPAHALGLAKRLVDLSSSMDRMSSFDVEVLVQSNNIGLPNFPEILAGGFQRLIRKD
ncbi:enoyl-CoA hydratase/isomerase family protein [bacterium]|nr:enoyl-CoA hydratase/isomerase family protein [bacterium]